MGVDIYPSCIQVWKAGQPGQATQDLPPQPKQVALETVCVRLDPAESKEQHDLPLQMPGLRNPCSCTHVAAQ